MAIWMDTERLYTANLPIVLRFTVAGWINIQTFVTYGGIFSFTGGSIISADTGKDGQYLNIGDNTYDNQGGTQLYTGTWYHVAWSRNSVNPADNNMYLNGELEIAAWQLETNSPSGELQFGRMGSSFYLNAYLAHFKVWNGVALTKAEIRQEMRYAAPVRRANLWAYWPFDLKDTKLIDSTGNVKLESSGGSGFYAAASLPPVVLEPYQPKIWWLGGGQGITFQYLRPSADTSLGSWTDEADGVTNIYTHIDETSPSDADYVQSPNNPSANIYKFKISTGSDPTVHTNHIISYRYRKPDSTGTVNLKVRLVEGTTTRKEWTHNDIGTTWTTQEQTLTEGEAATITDYSNLYLELEAG
jgi:hypothetical protein